METNFFCESAVFCHKDQGHVALSKNPDNQTTNMQSGFKDILFESPSFHGVTEIGAENDLPGHPVLPESVQMVLCGRGLLGLMSSVLGEPRLLPL